MRLQDWIDRVAAETNMDAQGTAELAAAKPEHRRDTAYLLYSQEAAQTASPGAVVVDVGISVVLAIRNFRDPRGAEGLHRIEAVRRSLLAALHGWKPPESAGRAYFTRGRVVDYTAHVTWWQDEYTVPVVIGA